MKINSINLYNPCFMGQKFVIGHKKPDTDSVCSAIAYADLSEKTKTDKSDYFTPLCAGDINKESQYALALFGVKAPKTVTDLNLKIGDIYRSQDKTESTVKKDSSVRELYNLMIRKQQSEVSVLDNLGQIIGYITPDEITKFNLSDTDLLKSLKHEDISFNKLKNILEAEVLTGEEFLNDSLTGNVNMGVYSRETTKDIELENSMVLVGDREDIQEEVINQGAKALVITKGKIPSAKILKLAKDNGIIIFTTQHGTSTSAKLLEQSTPVSTLATIRFKSFDVEDKLDDIKEAVTKSKQQFFPVTKNGKFVGIIPREKIFDPDEKEVILVDHNSSSQFAEGLKRENIKEILDHHKQEFVEPDYRIPLQFSTLGATASLIAKNYKANSIEIPQKIAGILWCAIVSDTDNFTSVTTTKEDIKIADELAKTAKIDNPKEVANNLLKQRDAALEDLSDEELIDYDRKNFTNGYSIAQISAFETSKYTDKINEFAAKLDEIDAKEGLSGSVFMISDRNKKTTYLACSKKIVKKSNDLLKKGSDEFLATKIKGTNITYKNVFEQISTNRFAKLPQVMSRKEQVEPMLNKMYK